MPRWLSSTSLTKRLECVRRKGGKQREMWGTLSEPFWTKNPFIPPSAHTSQSVERVCAVCSTDILIPVLLSLLPHLYCRNFRPHFLLPILFRLRLPMVTE